MFTDSSFVLLQLPLQATPWPDDEGESAEVSSITWNPLPEKRLEDFRLSYING